VFSDFGKGTALPADVASVAQEGQKEIGKLASFAEGDIKIQLQAITDAYGRIRVGLVTGDEAATTQGADEFLASLKSLDALCTSIGK